MEVDATGEADWAAEVEEKTGRLAKQAKAAKERRRGARGFMGSRKLERED